MAAEPVQRTPIRILKPEQFQAAPRRREARRPAKAAAPKTADTRAVVVAHGMGQPVHFATLDSVAEGLRAVDRARGNVPAKGSEVRPQVAKVNDTILRRVEMELHPTAGSKPVTVHLYEAYWAPLTEGEVKLRDVLNFLVGAGLNGFRLGFKKYERWMFGGMKPLRRAAATSWLLFGTLLVIGSLIGLNLAATAAVATFTAGATWPSRDLLSDWTWVLLGYGAILLAFVIAIGLALVAKRRMIRTSDNWRGRGRPSARGWAWWTVMWSLVVSAWALFPLALLGAIAAAGMLLVFAAGSGPDLRELSEWWIYGAWGSFLALSWFVRGFLVQYVGDVAAYVTSHKLDRFHKLRREIQSTVKAVGDAVYGHRVKGGNAFQYREVALVGHSLGSVIQYDLLNALLNEDELAEPGEKKHVRDRTATLLTFGSPLDKTAYIFRHHSQQTSEIREGLAAAVQPLIVDAQIRHDVPWVNIYSRADIISGRLDFYDPPGDPPWHVKNEADRHAVVPLAAHVEFWDNPAVWERLYDSVTT